ncbi:hypothetical protein KNR15_20430 [Alkalihalobacillus gibsonii]|nr:hypothetical protein [Alkalicoccobacillus gibsonii]
MKSLEKWFVYEYEHIDYLDMIEPIPMEKPNGEELIAELKQIFKNEGWEGDGEIGAIWLPPFLFYNNYNVSSHGYWVYHVKQQNNGTSFIASRLLLPFLPFLKQNTLKYTKQKQKLPIPENISDPKNSEGRNIIQDTVDDFKKDINSYKVNIEKELKAIDEISNQKIKEEIAEKILGYNQCMLIQLLHDFMDNCYFELLREVLENGNKSKLKLSKKSIKLDFNKHVYEDMDGDDWLTIKNIISDVWDDYKRTGFTDKLSRLTKPLDYEMSRLSKQDKELRNEIIKHTIIRNCIQHHNWQLDEDSLKHNLKNTDLIEVVTDGSTMKKIRIRDRIRLSKTELYKLIDNLDLFAETLSSYVDKKVKTRY